ncbi:teneurin-4-like [Sphaerodactylus townsendi]|uniref:teneurin-4-like n=1 Tax=Sphaerodactylus townsendi TaxID=933632 RepID=UPI002025DDAC|nr:teneurin-4-like [Sphaerodactylus townsendi]
MDILTSSRHDGAYNDGHFLFKPGGTSPLFCTTSQGYPLTSSTVYSPPPRPLPRSTFSRPAFNLKKPYKYCTWKCAALSAIIVSAALVILLAYFIAMHLFGLNWHLQPMEGQMYEITEDTASSWPVPTDVSLYSSGGTGLELPDRKGKGAGEECYANNCCFSMFALLQGSGVPKHAEFVGTFKWVLDATIGWAPYKTKLPTKQLP